MLQSSSSLDLSSSAAILVVDPLGVETVHQLWGASLQSFGTSSLLLKDGAATWTLSAAVCPTLHTPSPANTMKSSWRLVLTGSASQYRIVVSEVTLRIHELENFITRMDCYRIDDGFDVIKVGEHITIPERISAICDSIGGTYGPHFIISRAEGVPNPPEGKLYFPRFALEREDGVLVASWPNGSRFLPMSTIHYKNFLVGNVYFAILPDQHGKTTISSKYKLFIDADRLQMIEDPFRGKPFHKSLRDAKMVDAVLDSHYYRDTYLRMIITAISVFNMRGLVILVSDERFVPRPYRQNIVFFGKLRLSIFLDHLKRKGSPPAEVRRAVNSWNQCLSDVDHPSFSILEHSLCTTVSRIGVTRCLRLLTDHPLSINVESDPGSGFSMSDMHDTPDYLK